MEQEPESPVSLSEALLEEAESLTWALLDDRLDDESAQRLTALLEQSEAARRRYIECVQLHVDLRDHFAAKGDAEAPSASAVVLSNLIPGLPGAGSHPTIVE